MSPLSSINKCLNFICFPWKNKKCTGKKIAGWIAFFSIGWIYHPLKATKRCYKKIKTLDKSFTIWQKVFSQDSITKTLASFNNPHVADQIYGIYITTNETNLATIYQKLRAHPRPNHGAKTIHIGCAAWYNFDMMVQRNSNYGLIIDFNPQNAKFIEKTMEIIQSSGTREIFKQKMIHYLNSLHGKQRELFFHEDQQGLPTDRIEKELSREGSWLENEKSYLFIQKLVSRGAIIPITEDLSHYETFAKIRNTLDRHDIVIDTLYLSNVSNFIAEDQKASFTKSVKQLLNKEALFINCPKFLYRSTGHVKTLQQQAYLGKEILENSCETTKLFEYIL
ncbi:LIC_10091 family protein [Parachlamydia acanthamoebae]|uniref:LIC_10091 family protein n=1 Tax=Parachlamydia acanthamoebae TaxID=83552 RepID=UPI000750E768|nr:hypothetical protein [Parachlamydia acanthamoebae]